MDCKRIQELLATDYLDGRLSLPELKTVREHLAGCPSCAALEKELLAQREIFQQSKRASVPPEIWHNISSKIIIERLRKEQQAMLWERLIGMIRRPRPVFALASIFAVMIMVAAFSGIILRQRPAEKQEGAQQAASVYGLRPVNGEVISDLGTNIEKYFL